MSESKIRDGERDIVIEDKNRRWPTIYEALNLRSFDKDAKNEVERHINKLLDNYNPIGYPILYLVVYAEWARDKFEANKEEYFKYVKNSTNKRYTVKNRNEIEYGSGSFLYHTRIVYDCGGIPFTIHHIIVRVGDIDNDNLMDRVYELAKNNGQVTRKEVEQTYNIDTAKARAVLKRLCNEEQLLQRGRGKQTVYIYIGRKEQR